MPTMIPVTHSIPKPPNFVVAPLMALSLAIHLPWNVATAQSSEAAAAGLLIYKDVQHGQDELASVIEFSSAERVGRVTAVTPVGEGSGTIRILQELVSETVHYVDLSGGTIASEAQIAELRATPPRLGEIAKRYPKAYNLLAAEGQRIQAALQMFGQGKVLVEGNWLDKAEMARQAEAAASVTLTITGDDGQKRTLSSVRVTGVDPDALRVMHSEGAASIPIEALDEADRMKHGLDMAKAEAYRKEKAEVAATAAQRPQAATEATDQTGGPDGSKEEIRDPRQTAGLALLETTGDDRVSNSVSAVAIEGNSSLGEDPEPLSDQRGNEETSEALPLGAVATDPSSGASGPEIEYDDDVEGEGSPVLNWFLFWLIPALGIYLFFAEPIKVTQKVKHYGRRGTFLGSTEIPTGETRGGSPRLGVILAVVWLIGYLVYWAGKGISAL